MGVGKPSPWNVRNRVRWEVSEGGGGFFALLIKLHSLVTGNGIYSAGQVKLLLCWLGYTRRFDLDGYGKKRLAACTNTTGNTRDDGHYGRCGWLI